MQKYYKEYFCLLCMRISDKRGQIWVETVIYTLIGLAIIGLVLAGALPKINEKKDEMIIGRTIEALGNIDDKVYAVQQAVGSRRVINLDIRKGSLIVNPVNNSVSWILDSSFAYSEVGRAVSFGNMDITTTSKGGNYEIKVEIVYAVNLTYDGDDVRVKEFNVAPTPYRLVVENVGKDDGGNIVIDFLEA